MKNVCILAISLLFTTILTAQNGNQNIVGKWKIFEFQGEGGFSINYKKGETKTPKAFLDKFKGQKDSAMSVEMMVSIFKEMNTYSFTFDDKGQFEENTNKVHKGTFKTTDKELTTTEINKFNKEIKKVYQYSIANKLLTLEQNDEDGKVLKYIFEKVE